MILDLVRKMLVDYPQSLIFSRVNYAPKLDVPILTGSGAELHTLSLDNFTLIHWFRTGKNILFHEFILEKNRLGIEHPRIILTHCQNPTRHSLRLSIDELNYSDFFVFTSKYSLNHPKHHIIPNELKCTIFHATASEHFITSNLKRLNNSTIVYGRGSTSNKCSKSMFTTFKKIYSKLGNNTKFKIVISDNPEKIKKQIKNLDDQNYISIIAHQTRRNWLNFLENLDIFLYELPLDSYATLDGTMIDAMLSSLPIVYYGPTAPTELIENGVTGYIARSKEEFILFAIKLAKNHSLRIRMGKNARVRALTLFSYRNTVNSYKQLYNQLLNKIDKIPTVRMTILYYIQYFLSSLFNR